jgi:hypothetical protein
MHERVGIVAFSQELHATPDDALLYGTKDRDLVLDGEPGASGRQDQLFFSRESCGWDHSDSLGRTSDPG